MAIILMILFGRLKLPYLSSVVVGIILRTWFSEDAFTVGSVLVSVYGFVHGHFQMSK